MIYKIQTLLFSFVIVANAAYAAHAAYDGVRIDKFKVKGSCSMCEKRIESAAISVKGVSNASWNKKNQEIVVAFDESVTKLDKIQKAVSNSGHDTDIHKAPIEAYIKLSACCRYERAKKVPESNESENR